MNCSGRRGRGTGFSISSTTSAGHAATVALVSTAVTTYINSLVLGQSLSYFRLSQIAFDASSDVIDISGYTLNGGTLDVPASNQQVIKTTSVTVI